MITDRNGEPLAISTPVVTLWANPQELPGDAIQRVMLAQALGMSLDDFDARVARFASREFMYLRRHMTPEAAQRVLDLRTPGCIRSGNTSAITRLGKWWPNCWASPTWMTWARRGWSLLINLTWQVTPASGASSRIGGVVWCVSWG